MVLFFFFKLHAYADEFITDSISGKIGFKIPLIAFCIPSDPWLVSHAGFKIDLGRLDIAAKMMTQIGIFTKRKRKQCQRTKQLYCMKKMNTSQLNNLC
jgi:hypothetical protein